MARKTDTSPMAATAAAETAKQRKPKTFCACLSQVAYRVTHDDLPETDPEGFVEYDVYETCGGETEREFLPGHDAKLKSVLIKRHLDDDDFAYLSHEGGVLIHVSARKYAAQRGWEKFLDAAKARQNAKIAASDARAVARAEAKANKPVKATKAEKDAAAAKRRQEHVAKAAEPKAGFHPIRFKIGRWEYDGNVESEDVNELTVSYSNKKGQVVTSTIRRTQVIG